MLVILTINLILISPGYTVRTLNTSKPGDVTLSVSTGDEGMPTERGERGWRKRGDDTKRETNLLPRM